MVLNADLIQDPFRDIRQSVDKLETIASLSLERFMADQDTKDLACYHLLVAIEGAIQICFHICASHLGKVPGD